MKLLKRIGFLTMTLLLAASFSACRPDGAISSESVPPKESGSPKESVQQEKESAPEAGQEPLALVVTALGDASTEACVQVSEAASKILQEKYNTSVTLLRYGYLEYDKQLQLMLASGEKLDLMSSGFSSCNLDNLSSGGQVLSLNELLETTEPELYEAIGEDNWKCMQRDGNIYGVPNGKELASGYGFCCVTELLGQVDYDTGSIREEKDLTGLLRAVKQKFPDLDPVVTSGGMMGGTMAYMDNLGGGYGVLEDCRTDQTQVVNWFATDTYKEICQLHYEWAQEGLIMPDASSNAEPANTLIAAGTAFGYFHNNKPGIENEDKNATGKDMTMIPIIDAYSTTSNVSNCWMIPYQSEKPERALQVLKEMYTNPELANLVAYGLEGKHWKYVDEAEGLIDFPDGVSASTTEYSIAPWAWPNELITHVFGAGEDPELWSKTVEFNKMAYQSIGKGFSFDTAGVLNEIAACNNVSAKYDKPLMAGALDPEEALPKFLAELEAAGVTTVIGEKQRQFDAWLAGNAG